MAFVRVVQWYQICLTCMHVQWLERVQGVGGGVGTCILYKLDKQRRNTRGASSDIITECQFADDFVLLATTRETAEVAINTYQSETSSFGLTVSLPKKFMVAGFDGGKATY